MVDETLMQREEEERAELGEWTLPLFQEHHRCSAPGYTEPWVISVYLQEDKVVSQRHETLTKGTNTDVHIRYDL